MKKTLIKTFTGVMAVTAVVGAMAITSNAAEVPEQMTSETTASVETVAEVQDANPFHRLNRQAHDMVARYNAMGQGDVIDDQFVVDEGWGDVIDDQFAVDEGWGDVIDDQFVYVEGQGDVIDDEFAYVEGQGDVIDDEFAYVEGQCDVIDDEFAVVEATDVAENTLDESMPSEPTVLAIASAQSADEAQKDDDGMVFEYKPFDSWLCPFRAVPTQNTNENKSDALETVQTIEKFINPSDTVYGNPIRDAIDDCDVLGNDEKEYLKTSTSLLIGSSEGTALVDYIPVLGSVKKVGKVAESLVKLHDSTSAADTFNNSVDLVQNFTEAVICAVPGGGAALNTFKAGMALGSYCFKKVTKWLF